MNSDAYEEAIAKKIAEDTLKEAVQGWKTGFNSALTNMILSHGSPSASEEDQSIYYGWISHNFESMRQHLKSCEVISTTDPLPVSWESFDGTFVDSKTSHGFTMLVTCKCGVIQERLWRWEGSMEDALRYLLAHKSHD
jgi:hypothetical protein